MGRTARIRRGIIQSEESGSTQCKEEIKGAKVQTRSQTATRTNWEQRIVDMQDLDPVLNKVKSWGNKPDWDQIARESAAVKHYWTRFEQLEVQNGLLKLKWKQKDGTERWKIVVPEGLKLEIMEEIHGSKIGGHFGRKKSILKLKQSPYVWKNSATELKLFITACNSCARSKHTNRKNRSPMGSNPVGETMERIGIDITGPFPISNQGNRFILIVMDYWTKWVEAYPIPDHSAETVAKELVYKFFSRWGLPKSLHSDQGREFESKLFQEACTLLGIDKTRSTPWHPESNGLVERFNRSLGEMLRQITSKDQKDWDQNLDLVTMAYRSTVHDSTGQTPNLMMLGRELPMPSYLLCQEPNKEPRSPVDFVQTLKKQFQTVHEIAREQLKGSHETQKRSHDKGAKEPELKIGDLVWLYNPVRKKGLSPKLSKSWEEIPYKIEEFVNPLVIRMKRHPGTAERIVHVDKVKKAIMSMEEARISQATRPNMMEEDTQEVFDTTGTRGKTARVRNVTLGDFIAPVWALEIDTP